jgi:seryl-tRNA synthetase
LENYQTEDGVKVPEVLQPFMGGMDFMPFERGPMEATKGEKKSKKN